MPRHARCVFPGLAHHITQRGTNRADVFFSQADRRVYLELMAENIGSAQVRVLAWCLMTNHVHWVVVPENDDSLGTLFRRVHGRYAQYLNARKTRLGHLWQNRFFSCAVAAEREPVVLRYVESNPVRAGLVHQPQAYTWSSASAHLRGPERESIPLLDWNYWSQTGGADAWRRLLFQIEESREATEVRRATYAGAPLGSELFVERLEEKFGRHWRIPGRPRKAVGKQLTGTERSVTFIAS